MRFLFYNVWLFFCVMMVHFFVSTVANHPQETLIKEQRKTVRTPNRVLGSNQGTMPIARRVGRPIYFLGPSSAVSFPRGRWRRRHRVWANRARLEENVARRIRNERLRQQRLQSRLEQYAKRPQQNKPLVLGAAQKRPILKVKSVTDTRQIEQVDKARISRIAKSNSAVGIPIHIQDNSLSSSERRVQQGKIENIAKSLDVNHIVEKGGSITDLQNTSINQLLNERQPVFNSKEDEIELKAHLSTLKDIQTKNGLDATNERLIRIQLEYIDTVKDPLIKREVLKLFVKDIVENSGFLTKSQHTSSDITEMSSLLELIKSISSGQTIIRSNAQTTPVPKVELETNVVRNRISSGLEINQYRRSNKTVEQQEGVNLDHLVGLSIYGGRVRKNHTDPGVIEVKKRGSTTAPTTTEKFDPRFEPLGGNDVYWTHLTAGFQDMLCALCQKQNNESCIVRYCQDDV